MDETGLELDYTLRQCWMKRGHQKQLPLNAQPKQHTYLVGACDWLDNTLTVQRARKLNRHTMVDFLTHLMLDVYPNESVVLILDNARYHWANDTLACLALFEDRLRVVWLPKYAPELNLIERFWQHLKKTVCSHRLYNNIDQLYDAVADFIQLQNTPSFPERLTFSNSFL